MRRALLLGSLLLAAACSEPDAPGCASDADCPGGRCDGGTCVVAGSCGNRTDCGGSCVDVLTDAANCGACGEACPGGVSCHDGACCPSETPSVCADACVDTASSAAHCGRCGHACAEGEACVDGTCCPAGQVLCDGSCRDLASDPFACGSCDVRCPVGAACEAGSCGACPEAGEVATCGPLEVCGACSVEVPAGLFLMGTQGGDGPDRPQHQVTLSAFRIDVLEVTQVEYRACVEAGACSMPELLTDDREPEHPVTWVTWEQAWDYCAWKGGRLPSEAEWEKAARGEDGRKFPWGEDDPDCTRANFRNCGADRGRVGRRLGGASPYGVLDLSGNAIEWVNDWFSETEYQRGPVTDPPGPDTGTRRVRRGGSFDYAGEHLTTTFREDARAPDEFDSTTGFRCAYDP